MKKQFYCLVGIDGVGKTTVSRAILPRLNKELGPFNVRHIGKDYIPHGKLPFKPPKYVYSRKTEVKKRTVSKKKKIIRKIYHWVANVGMSLEFTMMYFFKERLSNRKKHLLLDHCPYDLLIEENRDRFPITEKILVWIMPRPTHILLLVDEYESIRKRKQQRTTVEMKEYYDNMRDLYKKHNIEYSEIYVGNGVEDAKEQVFQALKSKLKK